MKFNMEEHKNTYVISFILSLSYVNFCEFKNVYFTQNYRLPTFHSNVIYSKTLQIQSFEYVQSHKNV